MDIYMFASRNTPRPVVAQTLMDIADMHLSGYLPMNASVWANADMPERGQWVLTDKSSYTRMIRTVHAGWVRVTKTQARWGRIASDTIHSPTYTVRMDQIPGNRQRDVTLVVNHREAGKPVKILTDGGQRRVVGGSCSVSPFTVVDLPNFTRTENPSPSPFDAAHAMINGVDLMTSTLGPVGKNAVMDNIDAFKLVYDERMADAFSNPKTAAEELAEGVVDLIYYRLGELGITWPGERREETPVDHEEHLSFPVEEPDDEDLDGSGLSPSDVEYVGQHSD